MKVYVEKLPKECYCCVFNIEDVGGIGGYCIFGGGKKDCPLIPLADYPKQVRKKEHEKIKNLNQQLKSQPTEIIEKINGEIYTRMVVECKETKYTDINLILDTILKEY